MIIILLVALVVVIPVFAIAFGRLFYALAVYALPYKVGCIAATFAYATGAGVIGAGLAGLIAGDGSFLFLAALFTKLREPVAHVVIAMIFAGPAAAAGYGLVHDVLADAVPSPIWCELFCIAGGAFTGLAALVRLAMPIYSNRSLALMPACDGLLRRTQT